MSAGSTRVVCGAARRGSRLGRALSAATPVLLAATLLSAMARPPEGDSPAPPQAAPRALLLALDAVPFRVAEEACRRGAFAGWPSPAALVAPFPTMTHVSFASLFLPFGVAPSRGYEIHHFDTTANEIVGGGPLEYAKESPAWNDLLDAPGRNLMSKLSNYTSPRKAARKELAEIENEVLASPREIVIAYLGATDGIIHLQGDDQEVAFLVELDQRLRALAQRHLEARGRPLRIVLFSDHGSGRCKIHHAGSFERLLREAGLRVVERLEGPHDVAAPTFGLVNYGALFLRDAGRAETAARAMVRHEAVELAAWSPEPSVVEVVSRSGRARVLWRGPAGAVRYTYEDGGGDPLRLSVARRRLEAAGLLDAAGYAGENDWLRETAFEDYPDPLRRLAEALTGDRILSRATVLFSLGTCWSWGWRSAVAGAWIRGGRLEGTHGGLDRDSTLGFLLVSDPALAPPRAVRADVALAPFADAVRAGRERGAVEGTEKATRCGVPRERFSPLLPGPSCSRMLGDVER